MPKRGVLGFLCCCCYRAPTALVTVKLDAAQELEKQDLVGAGSYSFLCVCVCVSVDCVYYLFHGYNIIAAVTDNNNSTILLAPWQVQTLMSL